MQSDDRFATAADRQTRYPGRMTNYLPRYRKKLDRLEQLERNLCRALEHGDSDEKLEGIADRVRSAWISMYRAACSGLTAEGKRPENYADCKTSIHWWNNKTSGEIVSAYREGQFKVDLDQTRETSRGLCAQYGTDPFPEIRQVKIGKEGPDGVERDAVELVGDIRQFFHVDTWFVRDVIAVGSAAPQIEAFIGKGKFLSSDELDSCLDSIRRIRFGVFIAESEGNEVASVHSTGIDCWQVRSNNAAFMGHMITKYGKMDA